MYMYSPKYAVETDRKIIDQVILKNPFATIAYNLNGVPQSFHLPLILEKDSLIGHMAKKNPAWGELENNSALIIFHGPHCYISPNWYGTNNNVPTWNYISIQVRGKINIHHDEIFLKKALEILGNKYDPDFDMALNIKGNFKLLSSIVGIEIPVDEVFAKFKLAQSKSAEERINVIKVLTQSTNSVDQAVAKAMEESLKR